MEYETNQAYEERTARASTLLVKTMQELNRNGAGRKINEGYQEMLLRSYENSGVWDKVADGLLDDMYREVA